ncbi:MAG: glycoside hydrolase family 31 [Nitrospira sp.]|jgi:alpha-D-xyloside xylohydrolase|nr:glycoside hydrolase family 31 [Nitrospira sp.]
MRAPFEDIDAGVDVILSNGNQFRGGGRSGNQTQSGSAVMVRRAGDSAWTPLSVQFQATAGNDKFFFARVPANRFPAGALIQYYFKIEYSDRQTTFLHGDDARSFATTEEAAAQASPFTYSIRFSPDAQGPTVSFNAGPLQGRIYRNSGHIEIAGPDLGGVAQANVVALGPPAVEIENRLFNIGRVLTSAPLPNGVEVTQELGAEQVRTRLTFPVTGIMRYEVVDWGGEPPSRLVISAESDEDEHFYGFGEKFNQLDQAGKVVDIRVFDAPGDKGDQSYKVAPWFVSSRGYGFHLDSTARSTFDMRTAMNGRYRVSTEANNLRLNIVYGPRLPEVLMRYTEMTGRPPLPPPWVFGHWISSDEWRSGGEVRYAVSRFRQRGIPSSIFVFDSPWETAYNDFQFNRAQFAAGGEFEGQSFTGFTDPLEMMRFLQENGLKAVCWMTPFINTRSVDEDIPGQNLDEANNYREAADGNLFVRASAGGPPLEIDWWKGHGSPVDFSKPEARAWFQEQLRKLLEATEVDSATGKESAIGGFKTDDGEFGNGQEVYIPPTAVYANGLTGRQFINGYCVEYHRSVYDVLGETGFLFARSGFTGTQAFPAYWAGDNQPNFGDENGLRSVIVAGLSAAMSGFSAWAHDIGGYQNANFSPVSKADLFIRWTQFGCFSPIMQIHRQVDKSNLQQYPWGYAQAGESTNNNRALANYRFYARLHTRLFPYLYTYARVSQDTGMPILRPMVLQHQDDPRTFSIQHTYYFGADLLVAPVIQPRANSRRLYLPEGKWIDFWTHQRHAGKQDIVWQNPDQPEDPASKIPLYVRSGAIVPFLLGDDIQSLCDPNYINNPQIKTWDGGLDIHIYPDGDTQFEIFDGTRIESLASAGSITVRILSPVARECLLRILTSRPVIVRRDGTALPEAASVAAFDAAAAAWRFDSAGSFVLVKFPHSGGTVVITL